MARHTVAQFKKAIPNSGGILSTIAARVGCTWHTAKKRIEASAVLTELYEEERRKIDDKAQSNILQAVKDGDLSISKWWLQVKMADEFGDRVKQEISGPNGGPVEIDDTGLSDDERAERVVAILDKARTRRDRQDTGE